MQHLQYILFDFDGTLVNSEGFHFDCWNKTLEEFNVQISAEEYDDHLTGIPNHGNATYLINTYQLPIPVASLVTKHESLVQELYRQVDIEFMPYSWEILEWLKSKRIKMGLVTGSPRSDVEWVFEQTGLGQFFDVSVTCDDVIQSKPHPESYHKAKAHFLESRGMGIAIEDTPGGVNAAKCAGLTCFAVQSNPAKHDKLSNADKTFYNLEEVINFLNNNLANILLC